MIRAGFIGTGGIAGVHLRYLKSRPDVTVAALCDVSPDAVKARQQEFGGETFTDFRRMLRAARLDAVWLCTPPWVRQAPLLACAERKIPVFCEKPVERDPSRGVRIAAALAKRRARVQVGYVFRAMPIVRQLREAMADDRIHLIQSFYACNMSLQKDIRTWFFDKERSGGALVDQATHNLDLLRYLFGEVKSIHGMATNPVHRKRKGYTIEEAIGLVLVFGDDTVCSHVHTWVGDNWRNEMVFSGEKRLYRLNIGKGTLAVESTAGSTSVFKAGKASPPANLGSTLYVEQGSRSIYEYQNEIFLRQVVSGDWRTNPSDYADGLKTLQLTIACDDAVSAHRR